MLAIWTTFVLVITALAAAMTLTWRRWTAPEAKPVRVELRDAATCYPQAKR